MDVAIIGHISTNDRGGLPGDTTRLGTTVDKAAALLESLAVDGAESRINWRLGTRTSIY